jgi:uncharacterized protein with NRDE domain
VCLVVFAHDAHPRYRLVLGANRDEFHARPADALAEWPDAPGVFGGRDLQAGGTWLGVTWTGRWAAVTNFRDPEETAGRPASRGHLVSEFLTGRRPAREYLESLRPRLHEFSGFNLLVSDDSGTFWMSNRSVPRTPVTPLGRGLYGLSNHLLDTPWPKVERGKDGLRRLLQSSGVLPPTELLDLLLDRTRAADHELPDTGVGRDLERALSSPFIFTPEYGTRASSALLISASGEISVAERTFAPDGTLVGERLVQI